MIAEDSEQQETISAPEIARRLGVDVHKVHAWINAGELKAYDLSIDHESGRPRYRIRNRDLNQFLESRIVSKEEQND